MLEDFKLGKGNVIDDFGVYEKGMGQLLKGRKVIIVTDCFTNCCTAAIECLREVLAQFIP